MKTEQLERGKRIVKELKYIEEELAKLKRINDLLWSLAEDDAEYSDLQSAVYNGNISGLIPESIVREHATEIIQYLENRVFFLRKEFEEL